jgi:hypothetical protein
MAKSAGENAVPQKGDASEAGSNRGAWEHEKDRSDCGRTFDNAQTSLHVEQLKAAHRKRFETVRARLALAGWILTEQTDGVGYFAARWNGVRDLADLGAVESFAKQVGAPA